MKKFIDSDAVLTSAIVAIIMGVLTPFAGSLWPIMAGLWISWLIVTPLYIRNEMRRAH